MRRALMLLTLLALCGCSLAVSDTVPKPHGPGLVQTVQVSFDTMRAPSQTPPAGYVDLASVAHSALTVPRQIEQLRRAVILSCAVLAAIGAANAFLMICLLLSRRQKAKIEPVALAAAPSAAPSAAPVVPAALLRPKRCGCGAVISARTKSGRCRQCALDYRRGRVPSSLGRMYASSGD